MDKNSTLPPLGDPEKADKYISALVRLISKDKVKVTHTDLNKFDVTTMQNHYRIDLGEYEVEVSHSTQPETNKDFYTILFNNMKKIQDGKTDKVILGYIHLSDDQYGKFKIGADEYLERRQKEEDKERFAANLAPLDSLLSSIDPEEDLSETPPIESAPTQSLETPQGDYQTPTPQLIENPPTSKALDQF